MRSGWYHTWSRAQPGLELRHFSGSASRDRTKPFERSRLGVEPLQPSIMSTENGMDQSMPLRTAYSADSTSKLNKSTAGTRMARSSGPIGVHRTLYSLLLRGSAWLSPHFPSRSPAPVCFAGLPATLLQQPPGPVKLRLPAKGQSAVSARKIPGRVANSLAKFSWLASTSSKSNCYFVWNFWGFHSRGIWSSWNTY